MTERQPGEFARHPHTGAPYVAHPTETTKRTGTKAELFAELEAAGINWQSDLDIDPSRTPTIAQMQDLLGPRPKRVQYGRPSSLGNQIENMTNIQKWCERAVALGCFLRPELLEPLGDVDPAALNLDDGETRDLLDTIAVKGKDAARAGLSADRGTHGHELTEDSDNDRDWIVRAERGEHLGLPMEVQTALVAAWQRMLDVYGIEILAVESTCVDDQWRQAGTLDRICRLTRDLTFRTALGELVKLKAGTVVILDLKTGKLRLDSRGNVEHWQGYAVQVASYAQSVPYDPDTDTRGEWPWPIDQSYAIIAHLDILAALDGTAACRLFLVDLRAGREAGERCVWARGWEKRTDVFSVIDDALTVEVSVAAPSPPHGEVTTGLPPVEQHAEGGSTAPPVPTLGELRTMWATPDEGPDVDARLYEAAANSYKALTAEQRSFVNAVAGEAQRQGVSFHMKERPTLRRFEIMRGLLLLAAADAGEDDVRYCVATVMDSDAPMWPTVAAGWALGALDVGEAKRFAVLADDHAAGRLMVVNDRLVVVGVA
jgi:hypothetical protein